MLLALGLCAACVSREPSWSTYQTAGEAALGHARYAKAEDLLEQALARADAKRPEERVRSQGVLARVARERGDLPGARVRLAAAREAAAGRVAPDSAVAARLDLEGAWLTLAEGRSGEAALAFASAGEAVRRALGDGDPGVGWAAAGRGEALRRAGDRDGARAALDDALARLAGAADADSVTPERPVGLLAALTSRGALLREEGNLAEARAALRAAMTIGSRELGTEHPRLAVALAELALVELELGDLEAARRAAARADAIARSRLPEGHPTRLAAADALARCGGP